MYKRLRVYYLYTALPFLILLIGAGLYHKAIAKTITTNPHPQVNYLIFVIIVIGGILILMNIAKLMQEAQRLGEFTEARRAGMKDDDLQEMTLNFDADIAYVLRMLAASSGRSISHQEQIAIETELHKAEVRLNSRNVLPQFLGGLLVGMGLLGTFIGLLATLDDIAVLISSFATLDMNTADPISVFKEMVQRMEAPMHSMGIAFSASMYGLLGSIILGFMMVSVRRCMGEIMSILSSEVAQHIEFALARDGFSYSKNALKMGLGKRLPEALPVRQSAVGAVVAAAAPATSDVATTDTTTEAESKKKSIANVLAESTSKIKSLSVEGDARRDVAESTGSREALAIDFDGDDSDGRVLRRIEDRIAESTRIQERGLSLEIDDFRKQRADMLRALSENSEASNNFRAELQRVGRQLGTMLSAMEKSNVDIVDEMGDLKLLMRDDAAENQRLLAALIQLQREMLEQSRGVGTK